MVNFPRIFFLCYVLTPIHIKWWRVALSDERPPFHFFKNFIMLCPELCETSLCKNIFFIFKKNTIYNFWLTCCSVTNFHCYVLSSYDFYLHVIDIVMYRCCHIPRERPRGCRPHEERSVGHISFVIKKRELHGDCNIFNIFIPLIHFKVRECCPTAWTKMHRLESFIH